MVLHALSIGSGRRRANVRRTTGDGPNGPIGAWDHGPMTEQEERYDRIAEGYATWWSIVHREATLDLLDEVAIDVEAGARRIVDVGSGTGALAAAAVGRWDDVEIDAVDGSGSRTPTRTPCPSRTVRRTSS
jgi:hypothetical protein